MQTDPRPTLLQRFAGLATNRTAAVAMMGITGLLGVAFVAAPSLLGIKDEAFIQHWISAGSGMGHFVSLALVIAAFCILALLGAPQFVLVAATVVAFGSMTGFIYSFIGNYLACILGFWMGKGLGGGALRTMGGPKLELFMRRLEKHDILACALIRLVPTAPFMIVNMALGATSIRFRSFLIGTAIGSLPKLALFAWAGHAVRGIGVNGGPLHWVLLGAVVASWVFMAFVARRWMRDTDGEANP